MFMLFGQHLCAHVQGSIGESRLWIRFNFTSSAQYVLFVLFGLWDGR